MTESPNINPAMLTWAREAASASTDDVANRMHLAKKKYPSPGDRLVAIEAGDEQPTASEMKKIADLLKRPMLTFYLQNPPKPLATPPDFRTQGDRIISDQGYELSILVRRLKARQQELRDLLLDEGATPLEVIGSISNSMSAKDIASYIRKILTFALEDQFRASNKENLFNVLRSKIEDVGIFVQLAGDLGSHHSKISADEFRGMALVDDIAPFIVINSNDAAAAYNFTLIHEFVHLLLGESAISNASPFDKRISQNRQEILCNKVAAEFFMPAEPFLENWQIIEGQSIAVKVNILAKKWSLSRAAIARRLFELNQMTEDAWWSLFGAYQADWKKRKQDMQEREGGPAYHMLASRKLGTALLRAVFNAVDSGNVTYSRASRILSVKTKNFEALRQRVF